MKRTIPPKHMGLIRSLAASIYKTRCTDGQIEFDDLVSAGCVGYLEAIDRYTPEKGAKLETFLSYRIRGAIIDFLRASTYSTRYISVHMVSLSSEYNTFLLELETSCHWEDEFTPNFDRAKLFEYVKEIIGKMSEQVQKLIQGCFFEGKSIPEVSKEIGLSRSWASRLYRDAIKKIKAFCEYRIYADLHLKILAAQQK